MGCSLSCFYFEAFASFLQWVVQWETGSKGVIHYLDDFLFVGPAGSSSFGILLSTFTWFARKFAIPLALEKTIPPTTTLEFLGIQIDTVNREFRLPEEKVAKLRSILNSTLKSKKVKLKHIQSLIGHLNFATRVIPIGRVFNRRLIALTSGLDNPNWHIRIPQVVKDDLIVWQEFLENFNGITYWQGELFENAALNLYTDAAASAGFGAIFGTHWIADAWPSFWVELKLTKNLVLLEFFPLLVVLEVWGPQLANKRIVWHCDNMGVVQVVNNLSSNSPPVLRLLRQAVFRALKFNILIQAKHIPGCTNVVADALSRFQFNELWEIANYLDKEGTPCPQHLWNLVLPEFQNG
ncbi:uncharacterized protein LOC121397936 [Xenopus laevis]|uniref:Uncharacterized protein LOC121397936 n=1 Tax=Xenopus laevis TaxID=8355 RepID=A0A8J1LTX6_XENLA|nr:uncharacterized protein LOC121397936 [Xenopus laevis]